MAPIKVFCSLCKFYQIREMMSRDDTSGICAAEPERFVTVEDWHSVRTEKRFGDPAVKNSDNLCIDFQGRQMK